LRSISDTSLPPTRRKQLPTLRRHRGPEYTCDACVRSSVVPRLRPGIPRTKLRAEYFESIDLKDGKMRQVEFIVPIDAIRHDTGFCWTFELPEGVAIGDDVDNPAKSDLRLWEGDRPLGSPHADHNRIRNAGGGLYSHWGRNLYFSSAVADEPSATGLIYRIKASAADDEIKREDLSSSSPTATFPRLAAMAKELRRANKYGSADLLYNPGGDSERRVKMLEAKVEYLLDELYAAKSQLRRLVSASDQIENDVTYQLQTFDFQWKHLPYHDAFLSNPAWRDKAAADLCHRLEVDPSWLAGKRILDCGCGPGRHAWAFSSLGAHVTAFDMSDNGLIDAERECAAFTNTVIEKRNILEPLPYATDFDLVWCYGVIHCTGDTYRALSNICRHVRPGGLIYFMVYPEPERTNLDAYTYYHEVHAIRQLTQHLSLQDKSEVLKCIQGERWALSWFDAISSKINDLYTFEEARDLLQSLGFINVKRTALGEHSLNVVATKHA
jgi:SAM-dependent methyltransferase